MRGILVTTMPAGALQCSFCGLSPRTELHAAQGSFWTTPEPHSAPCGHPCIGGGIEAPVIQSHRGEGKCTDPGCSVLYPKKLKKLEKAQLPTWAFKILLPLLISSKE